MHHISRPSRPRRALGALLACAVTLGAAACSDDASADALTGPSLGVVAGERTDGAIQQRVTITPARPAQHDTVTIRSVLVNRGATPARIEHVVCGLDYDATPVLQDPFILCAAYSATATLAPGDSLVHQDRRVVGARPGSYTVRVKHLLQPTGLHVDLPLTVVQR